MTLSPTLLPSLRGFYAGFVTRAIAFIIDFLLVVVTEVLALLIIQLLLSFFGFSVLTRALFEPAESPNPSALFVASRLTIFVFGSSLLFNAYLLFSWLLVDKTIGQGIMGLRVLRSSGRPLTILPAIKRVLGIYLSILPLFLGFLWVLVDDRRQGWHDKLADSVVIYDWEARLGRRVRHWLARRQASFHPETPPPNKPSSL